MGKKNKDKKKVKGAEKTLAKTEKKLSNKMKKEIELLGEDDIENILSQIEKDEQKRLEVTESTIEQPSRRLNFGFVPHPLKEQLILYGGEFFNGQKTFIYNDLFFYNIPNNTWTVVKTPAGPPPRCGHHMVATATNKGQLWVFGGEFASSTQSQFYHYRDLWVFHLEEKKWEKITAPNGPSARSGHRMVYVKKQLIIFGGFYDNVKNYKYFNDIYSFDTENYKWTKLEPIGTPPAPRSGCCMVALNDGKVLVYGGYSKEKFKKDVDKGRVFTDAFILKTDKNETTKVQYKWIQTKIGGVHFSPRCSMPLTVSANNISAYCFGGVFDIEEDEENLAGNFFNDLLQLDLDKIIWKRIILLGKKNKEVRGGINKKSNKGTEMPKKGAYTEKLQSITILDDGVFKVTVEPSISSNTVSDISVMPPKVFQPSPRMNCGLAIKHGVLYLYGGMFEDGNKQISFSDFYSLDLKKLDEWKTIITDDVSTLEWLSSDSEEEKEDSEEDIESETE